MIARTRVKICGITNPEDAKCAVSAGADAIGLVFYPQSPRYVSIAQASEIVDVISPFVNVVGLFVNAREAFINEVLDQVAVDTMQFHGQESEQACSLYNRPYIKAVRMEENVDLNKLVQDYSSAMALLLDTYVQDVPGGTGKIFDWDRIPKELDKPVILAGGLDVSNVKHAITQVRPYAVDVSGGVESEKGKKDADKVINFIKETINA